MWNVQVKIQWKSGELANMLKMVVNGVHWGLLNKVPQVPWVPKCLKCPGTLSARVPWVPWVPDNLEYPSVLSGSIPECLQSVNRAPTECPIGTKFLTIVFSNK